ncbi:glycosyltransferase [Nitrosopumilus sp. K4]|uniref:glycosyltransferase n=1 Tax=Nitrosopumilus sp. K4 TaxID=2795383 RepID=UPI001BA7D62A|nr:glycosyltransferase [Nitrosopumilus sp. K4]QUC64457.1 glycosyltransferase [Nitrosopumilus sp. K4]
MKVLYAGNTANFGYVVTHYLRLNDVNMELFMKKNPSIPSDPIKKDPTLNNIYPNWITFYDDTKPLWKLNILKKICDYDIIQTNTGLIIYSYFSRKPYVAQPIGSELRITAFSNSVKGFLMRQALHKAKVVIISTLNQELLLKKLKIKNYLVIPCYPEFAFFHPPDGPKTDFFNNFTIFHPTNLNWKTKGNEILINGFAKFIKNYSNSLLIIVEHGKDIEKTHNLVTKLNIKKNVKFVNGPLDYNSLINHYHNADVIADQFVSDEIGSIGREAMCSQKPLLTSFDDILYQKQFNSSPPILKAKSPDDVCSKLELLVDKKTRDRYGKESRLWMEKNNSIDVFAKKNKIIYESIISKEKFEILRNKIENFKNY